MTNIVTITFQSTYKNSQGFAPLNERMAKCTPDTKDALMGLRGRVEAAGGALRVSDLFRSAAAQNEAHKNKPTLSPPAGQSWHETGRAFDIDLNALKPLTLAEFWLLARGVGVTPIIPQPNAGAAEAWHFERRGSHAIIAGRLGNRAGVESALLAIGLHVMRIGTRQVEARIQAGLHRLGADPGRLDGAIGPKTRAALEYAGFPEWRNAELMAHEVDDRLREQFPEEHA